MIVTIPINETFNFGGSLIVQRKQGTAQVGMILVKELRVLTS